MRAVSVPFSPARPSRLKNEPGIFPAAYIRSSTSTVSGRKSASRRSPAVAVARTIVSPWRTTTAPPACFAIRPVSNEISLPAISTESRVTAFTAHVVAFLSALRSAALAGLILRTEYMDATRSAGAIRSGVGHPGQRFAVDAGASASARSRARMPAARLRADERRDLAPLRRSRSKRSRSSPSARRVLPQVRVVGVRRDPRTARRGTPRSGPGAPPPRRRRRAAPRAGAWRRSRSGGTRARSGASRRRSCASAQRGQV